MVAYERRLAACVVFVSHKFGVAGLGVWEVDLEICRQILVWFLQVEVFHAHSRIVGSLEQVDRRVGFPVVAVERIYSRYAL